MSIWSNATITRFTEDSEVYIAKELKCIIARYSIPVVQGTPIYILPDDVLSLRRVTWLGKKVDPIPARYFHDINTINSQSEPLFYIFNQQGQNSIRFHPVPHLTVPQLTTGLFGINIGTAAIVEYYQIPNGYTSTIPAYIRKRLIKYYVMEHCFQQEGPGQNLKAALKMKSRFDMYLKIFKKIYTSHFLIQTQELEGARRMVINPPPKLSYKFGEEGEF